MATTIPDDAPAVSSTLAALLAEAADAEAKASASALTPEDALVAAALARIEAARDARALAERTKRHSATALREKAARAACFAVDKRAIVGSIDLVDMFPVGNSPDPETMPGKGALILRSPTPERCNGFHSDVQANVKTLSAASADLAVECVVDPDVSGPEGIRLRGFLDAYPNIAIAVGSKALVLGGSRAAADKRGHG